MLSSAILYAVIEVIGKDSPSISDVVYINNVGGGCINQTYSIKTNDGKIFVKTNSASRYPGMFEAEARGLGLLAGAGELAVPKVIGSGSADGNAFLVLEFIESGFKSNDFWENFGRGLARLHKVKSEYYGLDHDNYIGSLPQANNQTKSWEEFFVSQRLEPQIKLARQSRLIPTATEQSFSKLFNHLDEFFPKEKPALLHGDLWGGNYMTGPNGETVIIDPAVYFGHRYMDLGMSKLFGGFSEAFYRFYHDEFPLEGNWHQGVEVANLYPLMVHVNLFGSGYLSSVNQTLKRFA